jgi:hypothetical protein
VQPSTPRQATLRAGKQKREKDRGQYGRKRERRKKNKMDIKVWKEREE